MKRYILAHDLGTSGNKATLFDDSGKMISSCTEGYDTYYSDGKMAEQNPEDWWQSVCISSRKVLSGINTDELAVVSFSGQMMACLCVDKKGRALKNALIYSDQRSEAQAATLIEKNGFENIFRITGHRPSSSYSLTKLMWIRDNAQEVFKDTFKMLQAKDYMNLKLTGQFVTDYNDASGTNAFDLKELDWSTGIIESAGIDPALFPKTVSSDSIIGTVTTEASAATGIPEGTPVAAGAGDGGCATVGAGSYDIGQAYCYMGSSSWVSITSDRVLADDEMKTFTWAHPIKGLYQPCGTMQTAGSSLNWFSKLMQGNTEAESLEELNELADASIPGAGGLFFLPYLLGERSPWWDSDARGCFIGLDLSSEKKDMTRAVIEGIAMNLNESLRIMKAGSNFKSIKFIGGGANGRVLRQIFADIFGLTIEIPRLLSEATSMGAAVIGGVGAGVYPGFEIVEKMNPVIESIQPDPELGDFYKDHSDIFVELYHDLKSSFGRISRS
ncbi:MAG: xylulokinase [Spirochaetales bacterium]|uniref:Xylulose kinase n=1 Tax=Candidatus Thalassospirochaeta sargassi TaxID=3119039 RepID=A0AAJ1MIT8_9SPIO|nr:xylulokinase [Spirochaetales bacterium]